MNLTALRVAQLTAKLWSKKSNYECTSTNLNDQTTLLLLWSFHLCLPSFGNPFPCFDVIYPFVTPISYSWLSHLANPGLLHIPICTASKMSISGAGGSVDSGRCGGLSGVVPDQLDSEQSEGKMHRWRLDFRDDDWWRDRAFKFLIKNLAGMVYFFPTMIACITSPPLFCNLAYIIWHQFTVHSTDLNLGTGQGTKLT